MFLVFYQSTEYRLHTAQSTLEHFLPFFSGCDVLRVTFHLFSLFFFYVIIYFLFLYFCNSLVAALIHSNNNAKHYIICVIKCLYKYFLEICCFHLVVILLFSIFSRLCNAYVLYDTIVCYFFFLLKDTSLASYAPSTSFLLRLLIKQVHF